MPVLTVVLGVEIKPFPINKPPSFSPALMSSTTIQMTTKPESWTLLLPKIVDPENDAVKLTVNFGDAANFVTLNGEISINISDISQGNSNIRSGMFTLTFTLSDVKNTVDFTVSLVVIDPSKKENAEQPKH